MVKLAKFSVESASIEDQKRILVKMGKKPEDVNHLSDEEFFKLKGRLCESERKKMLVLFHEEAMRKNIEPFSDEKKQNSVSLAAKYDMRKDRQ